MLIEQFSGDNIMVEEEKMENDFPRGPMGRVGGKVISEIMVSSESANNPNTQRYMARESRIKKSKDFAITGKGTTE